MACAAPVRPRRAVLVQKFKSRSVQASVPPARAPFYADAYGRACQRNLSVEMGDGTGDGARPGDAAVLAVLDALAGSTGLASRVLELVSAREGGATGW